MTLATILTFIYVNATYELKKTLRVQIAAEMSVLQSIFKARGYTELARTIQERSNAPGTGIFLYAMVDKDGAQILGNLPADKLVEGWSEIDVKSNIVDPADEGDTILLMLGSRLATGNLLIVGAGLDQVYDLRQIIIKSLISSLALMLPLALGSGVLLSRAALARVSTIHRTSRTIMAGDLSRRLPIRGSGDEFDQLSESINAMLDRIEALMGTMKQVTNDIAHDLRTPLGRLRQRLEAAKLGHPTIEGCLDALEKAKADTDQILRIFDALLQIGQIEALDMGKLFTTVDLSALAAELVDIYQPLVAEKGQRFAAQVAPGLCVQGHRELLAQMLVNLIENAVNHCPEGADIGLWLGSRAERVMLILSDTGPGIPAEHRRKIFQPFYRLERSRKTPGSGLGLALVRSIAVIHGVGIAMGDNDPGLEVRLTFPRRTRVATRPRLSEPVPADG
ncbi:MAG: HAMP domain-containing sensor histidine kinase [Rhodomicrobiaceae bacterium]